MASAKGKIPTGKAQKPTKASDEDSGGALSQAERQNLATNIKAVRAELGLTQDQLIEQLGVLRSQLQKWEQAAVLPDVTRLIVLGRMVGRPALAFLERQLPPVDIRHAREDWPVPATDSPDEKEILSANLAAFLAELSQESGRAPGREISPQELAEHTGVNAFTFIRAQSGRQGLRLTRAVALARFHGRRIEDFYMRTPPPIRPEHQPASLRVSVIGRWPRDLLEQLDRFVAELDEERRRRLQPAGARTGARRPATPAGAAARQRPPFIDISDEKGPGFIRAEAPRRPSGPSSERPARPERPAGRSR